MTVPGPRAPSPRSNLLLGVLATLVALQLGSRPAPLVSSGGRAGSEVLAETAPGGGGWAPVGAEGAAGGTERAPGGGEAGGGPVEAGGGAGGSPDVPLREADLPHPLGLTAPPPTSPAAPTGIRYLWDLPGSGVAPGAPAVALTFDDGPDPVYTTQILDLLGRRGAFGTFFMVGRVAASHPDLVHLVVAAGQTVASHTWNHADLRTLPDAAYPTEVDGTNSLLYHMSDQPIRCVRPPRGDTDARVTQLLAARGMANVMWAVDPTDWARPGPLAIAQRVLAAAGPGVIILLHDGGGDRSQTVAALPLILDGLRARGLVTVPMCR